METSERFFLPGLVVIIVFEITVAVMQFRNLSKFILTSEANITVWRKKFKIITWGHKKRQILSLIIKV